MSQRIVSGLTACVVLLLASSVDAQRPRNPRSRRGEQPAKAAPQEKPARQKLPIFLSSEDGKSIQVLPDPDGFSLEEFVVAWCDATGSRASWSPQGMRSQTKIMLSSVVTVQTDKLDYWCQSVLSAQGMMLIPVGPESARTFSLVNADSSRRLKSSSTWIDAKDAVKASMNPARVYSTVIQLQHIRVQSARGALMGMAGNRATTAIGEINESNSIHVVAPGDTLYTIVQAILAFDKPLPEAIRKAQESMGPGRRRK